VDKLPAWVGPLHCSECGDQELQAFPAQRIVRCTSCGWAGDLWVTERATLQGLVGVLAEVLVDEERDGGPPAAA
jgi:hypothetical protein